MICPKSSLVAIERGAAVEVARRVAARELSLSALAGKCEISQAHLSNWARGRRGVSLGVLDAVLVHLRLAPCVLLSCGGCVYAAVPAAELAAAVVAPAARRVRRAPWRRRRTPEEVAA